MASARARSQHPDIAVDSDDSPGEHGAAATAGANEAVPASSAALRDDQENVAVAGTSSAGEDRTHSVSDAIREVSAFFAQIPDFARDRIIERCFPPPPPSGSRSPRPNTSASWSHSSSVSPPKSATSVRRRVEIWSANNVNDLSKLIWTGAMAPFLSPEGIPADRRAEFSLNFPTDSAVQLVDRNNTKNVPQSLAAALQSLLLRRPSAAAIVAGISFSECVKVLHRLLVEHGRKVAPSVIRVAHPCDRSPQVNREEKLTGSQDYDIMESEQTRLRYLNIGGGQGLIVDPRHFPASSLSNIEAPYGTFFQLSSTNAAASETSESDLQEHDTKPARKLELFELFLKKDGKEFVHEFEQLLRELPDGPVQYDELFLYFFLAPVATITKRIADDIEFEMVYFHLDVTCESGKCKILNLVFQLHNILHGACYVFRTIVVSVDDDMGLNDDACTDDKTNDIVLQLSDFDDPVDDYDPIPALSSKTFHIALKSRTVTEYPGTLCPNAHAEQFKTFDDEEMAEKREQFENALEQLSSLDVEEVKKSAETLFQLFADVCRNDKLAMLSVDGTQQNANQYKESRFHGFIYGAIMLNWKQCFEIECASERSAGMGGGADLMLISYKGRNRYSNLNAIPVVVELKADQNAEIGLKQVRGNKQPVMKSFADKVVLVCASLFDPNAYKTKRSMWKHVKVEVASVPVSHGLAVPIIKHANNTHIDGASMKAEIEQELQAINYSIPAVRHLRDKSCKYSHRTYLSRLVLGQLLTGIAESQQKFAFIFDDSALRERVTTFVLLLSDHKVVVLSIIELDAKEQFNWHDVVPELGEKVASAGVIVKIDVKVNFVSPDFYSDNKNKPISESSYLQGVFVKALSRDEYRSMSMRTGSLRQLETVTSFTDSDGKGFDVKKLEFGLRTSLIPVKELLHVHQLRDRKHEHKVLWSEAQLNLQAILHGLFMAMKSGVAKEERQFRVLTDVNIHHKKSVNLVVCVGDTFRERDAVFFFHEKPNDSTARCLKSLINGTVVRTVHINGERPFSDTSSPPAPKGSLFVLMETVFPFVPETVNDELDDFTAWLYSGDHSKVVDLQKYDDSRVKKRLHKLTDDDVKMSVILVADGQLEN